MVLFVEHGVATTCTKASGEGNRELQDTNKSTVNMVPPCWSFTPLNKPPPSAVVVITWCIVSNTSSISSCSCSREEGVSFHNKMAAYLHSGLQSEECSCWGQAHAGQPLHWSRKSSSHTLWPEQLHQIQIMTGWDCAGKLVFTLGKQELMLSLAVVRKLYSLLCFYQWNCAPDYCGTAAQAAFIFVGVLLGSFSPSNKPDPVITLF